MPVSEKDNNRVKNFIKNNYRWVNVMFRNNSEEDQRILAWLDKTIPSKPGKRSADKLDSRSDYIKRLILADMRNRGEE